MTHPRGRSLRTFGAGLAVCALLVFVAAAAAQTPTGLQSAGGSATNDLAAEIKGLPPVDPGPMTPIEINRPVSPKQLDPAYAPNLSNYQYDTGPMIDAPTIAKSFTGIADTGWLPPDPVIAAGPSYVVAAVNSHIAYFSKSGKRLFQTSATSFFSPLGVSGLKIFDPWVIYDEHVDRFMVLFAAKPTSTVVYNNYNLIAISKTSSPLGGWWLYKNDMTLNGSSKVQYWGDYPKIATDRNAIYITANMYAFNGGFGYAKVRILQNKAALVAGNASQSWWDWWNITVSGSTTVKAFTIQPCHDYDSKGTTTAAYFVSSVSGTGSNIYFYAITNVNNRSPGPVMTKAAVAVGAYKSPGNFPQLGGTELVENVAPRLMNAVKRNGSVWTAHSIYQNSTASSARWYEFKVNSWPTTGAPTKRQEQSFWGSNLHYSFPSVAVNANNDMAMVFCSSGTSSYISSRWTGRRSTRTLNTLEGSAQLKAGEAYYVRKSRGRNRWGDYLGCASAPDGSIWFIGQYAESNPSNKWGTWIGQVYPEPTYWVSNFGNTYGKSLLGVDTGGRVTTSISLAAGTSPDSVCMDYSSNRVLVFDTNRIFRFYTDTGGLFTSTLTTGSGSISWGGVNEGGGIFWVTSGGRLYRASSAYGAGTTLVRSLPGSNYSSVAWNGRTGGYVALTYGTSSSTARAHFIAQDGTFLRNATAPTYASGIDYDPYTGYFYISRFGTVSPVTPYGLARMSTTGAWSYLSSSNNVRSATANSVECREQPYSSTRLYGTEYGASPQHLWYAYTSGYPYQIHASSGSIGPSDLAINRSRVLWPTTKFRVGSSGYFSLNFGPKHAGDTYRVCTSGRHEPGFAVPNGWVHLVPDQFFTACILGWDGGAVWRRFAGFLNANGYPTAGSPYMTIPNIPALKGLRFYFAAVAYNATEGIRAASNMCGVTFE